MEKHSHVPKFGDWDGEENVPYTAYFEKARNDRTGGRMVNPNDPQENPDLVSDYPSPARAPPPPVRAEPEEPTGRGAVRRAHERRKSGEDGELKQFADSPARHDNMNRRAGNDPAPQRYGGHGTSTGETHRRPSRKSAGYENSIERSPLHHQARVSGRSSGAPSPLHHSYDTSHGTPGRSRMRPKGDESPEKGAAVPKFGEWDENNPASADGFSYIFNKVREERQTGAGRVPGIPTESSHGYVRKQTPSDSSKSCCFPWGRK